MDAFFFPRFQHRSCKRIRVLFPESVGMLAMRAWMQWHEYFGIWVVVRAGGQPSLPCHVNAKNMACISQGGWTERRGGLFMQQGGLLPHICVGLLLFSLTSGGALGNSEGSHEVCSHVQGLVTSQAEMLKVWFRRFFFFFLSHMGEIICM